MIKKIIKLAISSFAVTICLGLQTINAMDSEDQFNFLSNQYPHLLERAEKPFQRCSEETKHYKKLDQLAESTSKSPAATLFDGAVDAVSKTTLHWFGKEHETFMLNQFRPFIEAFEQNHPRNGYFNTFFCQALTNHTILENLLLASEYIFQVVKDEGGGTVLFLGRTPCLVQVAYEELLKAENDGAQVPIHLSFSGHPDALTKRESSFFSSTTNIARDIVTPEKLAHYFSYLDTKDILKAKKVFIVDIIGSGGSLNSFLRIINAYYQKRETGIPNLCFLNLTQDVNWSADRSEFYTFEKTANVTNRGILTLLEDAEKNMKPFQINAYNVPIFEKAIDDILDADMFQEFLVHGIQYPAQKWTPEFDQERETGGAYHQEFYQYLREKFSAFIPSHQEMKL